MPRPERSLLLTCEHGGNRVPRAYAGLFSEKKRLLATHRGWDPGALSVARSLAAAMRAPLIAATHTRLLVDLNRSPHNRAVFSPITDKLPAAERAQLLERYHAPHWRRVRRAIRERARRGNAVLHLAVHSFTPVRDGLRRNFQVGLLYDPRRQRESACAQAWRDGLRRRNSRLRVRRNAPYRGNADGLTTALRKELPERMYLGLELELNQAALSQRASRQKLVRLLIETLSELDLD